MNTLVDETVPVSVTIEGWNSALSIEVNMLVHNDATVADFQKVLGGIVRNIGIFKTHQVLIWGSDERIETVTQEPAIGRTQYCGMWTEEEKNEKERKIWWKKIGENGGCTNTR